MLQLLSMPQILAAAVDVVQTTRSIGFVCCATDGPPSCRVMDIQGPSTDGEMRFRLITRPFSRKVISLQAPEAISRPVIYLMSHSFAHKVNQLHDTPEAISLCFHDPSASGENGYAVFNGSVRQLQSVNEKAAEWKGTWSFFHPNGGYYSRYFPSGQPGRRFHAATHPPDFIVKRVVTSTGHSLHLGPAGDSIVWEFTPERIECINHRMLVAPAWRSATLMRSEPRPDGPVWELAPLPLPSRSPKRVSAMVDAMAAT